MLFIQFILGITEILNLRFETKIQQEFRVHHMCIIISSDSHICIEAICYFYHLCTGTCKLDLDDLVSIETTSNCETLPVTATHLGSCAQFLTIRSLISH
jgi:hypothetical protein